MIRSRGIVFLIAAAVLLFLVVNIFLRKPEVHSKQDSLVMAAAGDIVPGTALSGALVFKMAWHGNQIPDGSFTEPGEIQGRVTASRILKGEVITEKRLVPEGNAPDNELSVRIEPGMRAVTILLTADTGLTGQIEAGDMVDVIVTNSLSDDNRISRMLFENVRVLSAGDDENGKSRGADKKKPVTLLLTPEEAVKLLAEEEKRIRLAVRNPYDDKKQNVDAVVFSPRNGAVPQDRLRQMGRNHFEQLCNSIPEKMRAVTIPVMDTDGICGNLWRGSRVDLVGTHEFVGTSSVSREEGVVTSIKKISKVVMQNLEILAVDSDVQDFMPDHTTENIGSSSEKKIFLLRGVTLLVTPADAEKLTVLADTSDIRIVLRRKDDAGKMNLPDREGASSDNVFKKGESETMKTEIIRGTSKDIRNFDDSYDTVTEINRELENQEI